MLDAFFYALVCEQVFQSVVLFRGFEYLEYLVSYVEMDVVLEVDVKLVRGLGKMGLDGAISF